MDDAEAVFQDLVTASWDSHHASFYDDRADEVVVGALIATLVGGGYDLIGLHSDGDDHHVRFARPDAPTRLVVRLTRKAGRQASLILGYGERTPDLARIWPSFGPEAKSLHSPAWEPGILSFDADLGAGYLYTQISLLLDLDRYLGKDFRIDRELFSRHIEGTVECLRRYLRGRLGTPPPTDPGPAPRDCDHERMVGKLIAVAASVGFPVIGLASGNDNWRIRFRAQTDPTLHAVLVGVKLPTLTLQAEVKNYLPHPGQLLELAEQLKNLPAGMSYRMNSVFAKEEVTPGADLKTQLTEVVGRLRERLAPFKRSYSPFSQKFQRPKATERECEDLPSSS